METLPHSYPGIISRLEYRYPFLDRQLVDYLFSIPPRQLVRPGRRRSLMRRALESIVPEEILERRRKAYQIRGPLSAIQRDRSKIDRLFANAHISDRGLIQLTGLQAALSLTNKGNDIRWWKALMRAIAFELWLKESAASCAMDRNTTHVHNLLLLDSGANKIRTIRLLTDPIVRKSRKIEVKTHEVH